MIDVKNTSVPMDDGTTMLLMNILMNPGAVDFSEHSPPPLIQIMRNRIPESVRSEYSDELILFCSQLAKGNPGHGIMWTWTLVKNGIKTINDLVDRFPNGFPTDEGFVTVWNAQKDREHGVNKLDSSEPWENAVKVVDT